MRNHTERRPEDRIAADLGLTTADLERIVRHERAQELVPQLLDAVRKTCDALAGWRDNRPELIEHGNLEEFKYLVIDPLIDRIYAPIGGGA